MAERRPSPRPTVRFRFQGRVLEAPAGATVAAGLLANGVRALRATRAGRHPRGLFCGIGNCFDCLVDVGYAPGQRACRRVLADGDDVRPAGPPAGTAAPDAAGDVEVIGCPLVVVGAGPAGMAASLAAADAGCDVVLVDAGPDLGGQIHRQPELPAPEPPEAGPRPPDGLPDRFRRLATHPRVRHLRRAEVWAARAAEGGGARLNVRTASGQVRVDARAAVLATGAVELALPFPGWDLPGVVTAGAAQALLKGQETLVGRRVVVGGSGPFLLPVAAGLAAAGAEVLEVCEAAPAGALPPRLAGLARHPGTLVEAGGYLAALLRRRVPVRPGHGVVACHGDGAVEAVTIARLDRDWRPVAGSERRVEVDAVCVGHGFVPDLALARALGCDDRPDPPRPAPAASHDADLATAVRGVFVAGEVTGVAGATVAELEGRLAGLSAARHLGHGPGIGRGDERRLRRRLRRARHLAAVLARLYPIGGGWTAWLHADTPVCRCEEATWAAVGDAVAAGADDLRAVRGVTRCGMGYCQGRVCGPPLQLAVAALSGRPPADVGDLHGRTLNLPVPLGEVAAGLSPPVEVTPSGAPGRRSRRA
jgi:thioredoxin reductase